MAIENKSCRTWVTIETARRIKKIADFKIKVKIIKIKLA